MPLSKMALILNFSFVCFPSVIHFLRLIKLIKMFFILVIRVLYPSEFYYLCIIVPGRNSGVELGQPSFLNHQSSNIFHDPKLSPVQKRGSASPSPSITSNNKELTIRSCLEYDTGVQEITEIPDDYLNESSVLKHLAKEVKVPSPNGTVKDNIENISQKFDSHLDFINRPPPPEYPKWSNKPRNKVNMEKANLSKSQPDLSKVGIDKVGGDLMTFKKGASSPRPKTKGREVESKSENIWCSNELIDTLIKENSALKMELDNMYQKVSKSQKVIM